MEGIVYMLSQIIYSMGGIFSGMPLFPNGMNVYNFIMYLFGYNPLLLLAIGMFVFYELNLLLKSIIHINS